MDIISSTSSSTAATESIATVDEVISVVYSLDLPGLWTAEDHGRREKFDDDGPKLCDNADTIDEYSRCVESYAK